MKKKKQVKAKASKAKTTKKSSPLTTLLKKVQTANSFDQNQGYCDGYSGSGC